MADVSRAREEALLQLHLGRQALFFGLIVGVVALLDSYITLALGTSTLFASQGALFQQTLPLIIPIFAGAFLSVAIFFEKLEPYGFWPFEEHFAVTVASVPYSLALVALYFLQVLHKGPALLEGPVVYVYPLVLVSIALPMVSLGLTWRGASWRKIVSLVMAALPPVVFFPLYAALDHINPSPDLMLSAVFSSAAFLTIASGALLHLMASSTKAQEREVVAGGHEKLFQLSTELSNRAEAIGFRENALTQREADVEAQAASQAETGRFLEDRRRELEALESHLKARSDEVGTRSRDMITQSADVSAKEESLKAREAQLAARTQEVNDRFAQLGTREQGLIAREQASHQAEIDAQARAAEVSRREAQIQGTEAAAAARLKEAETRYATILQREAELKARETTLPIPPPDRGRVLGLEQDIGRREATLKAAQAQLNDERAALNQRLQNAENSRVELQKMAAAILEREKGVAGRESRIAAKEQELQLNVDLLKGATQRHEDEIRKVFEASRVAKETEGRAALRITEFSEREGPLKEREAKLGQREAAVQSSRESLQRLERELEVRMRSLSAREGDLRLRESQLAQSMARNLGPIAGSPAPSSSSSDRERALDIRERQLAEREQKIRAMLYERDKVAAEEGPSLIGRASAGATHLPGRIRTGTPRLDDLLLGGFPAKAHVGFVGPAFSGKEVAMYAFLAEGLRHGEPAIVVATSRSPKEIAQELGVLVPSLVEYEQAGLLRWIDASSRDGGPAMDTRALRGVSVKGPGDYTALLQAIVNQSIELEKKGKGIRVGFFSLSSSLTQADDRQAFNFLQSLVGVLKVRNAVAVYAVDRGVHTDHQLEAIQTRMDGSLIFKTENGKSTFSVMGLGDVQTRTWVEYKFNQRGLQVGSFSLERIR